MKMEFENWKNENLTVNEDGTLSHMVERWGKKRKHLVSFDTFEDCWGEARKDPEARVLYYKNLLYNQSALHRRVLELEEKLGVGPEDWKKFNEEFRR
jgi:hypothetical protein